MKVFHAVFIKVLAIALVFIGMYGCSQPGKVTGGGFIPSAGSETGKANFGFNADSCDGYVKGRFNYHDKDASNFDGGVRMNGEVVDAGQCSSFSGSLEDITAACEYAVDKCGEDSYGVQIFYRSTNPKVPGKGSNEPREGDAFACATDNGEGINATSADFAALKVVSGPYAGYKNEGDVQGNIQAHNCD